MTAHGDGTRARVPERDEGKGRRRFLQAAGAGALLSAAGASGYVAFTRQPEESPTLGATPVEDSTDGSVVTDEEAEEGASTAEGSAADGLPIVEWAMPTSWPTSLPVLYGNVELFAQRVGELTSGRFRITAAPAGELTNPVGILDAVNSSEFSIGSTASYYYVEQSPVLAFATAVPFGLTMRQHVSWLYYGGGLQLLQQHFAENFNVIQFPAGNTGAQMGGWFTNEVNSLSDLEGLRMRIPGLGGQVMQRLGVEVVSLGAGDITAALSAGEIDAAEFVGPYDDSRLGLQDSAGFYYYPGFWEPGASFDLMINLDAWNALPPLYQAAVRSAAFESVVRVTAEYDARNGQALNELVSSGTELREFPADILQAGEAASGLLLDELAAGDAEFSEVLNQWRAFRRQITPWFSLAQSGL